MNSRSEKFPLYGLLFVGLFSAALIAACSENPERTSDDADGTEADTPDEANDPDADMPNDAGDADPDLESDSGDPDADEPDAADVPDEADSPELRPSADLPGYELAWQDEFDGDGLDTSTWEIITGSRRDAINTADAVSVSDGVLRITTYTDAGIHYTGFLSSSGNYEPTYGFIESRILFQPSPGEWGAFWLQSNTMGNPVGDPATAGAEIDIVEHRAVDGSGTDISDQFASTVHWDGYGADHQSDTSGPLPPEPAGTLSGSWHVYGVLWTDTGYTFYFDGEPLWTTSSGLSRRSEHLRLTCEVEDASWAGNIPAGGYGTHETSTTIMQVDWVRVWQLP